MANQKEQVATKPKFQQTKLCFAPVSTPSATIKKREHYAEQLQQEILDLKITSEQEVNQHEDVCKQSDHSRTKIQCTAIKQHSSDPCQYSFCDKCIKTWANEDVEWIKNSNADYRYADGELIQHRPEITEFKWACLVCRGLCKCRFCSKQSSSKKQGNSLFFNTTPAKLIEPPELEPLTMLYSEEEIWIRLKIREFIFRFGDICALDDRMLFSLQNVQGDWKIKKLGAYLVYHFLTTISQPTEYDSPYTTTSSTTTNASAANQSSETIPGKAKSILNEWIKEKKLTKYYLDNESRSQALLNILTTEGMTGRRWQDMAELLVLAEYQDIPIPTRTDKNIQKATDIDDDDDYDAMDIDEEEELERQIERFRKPVRNTALLTTQAELRLLDMLLELLLHHTQIRQSLNTPSYLGFASKEINEKAQELKKCIKEYNLEATKNKSKQYQLITRINQLKAVRGKRDELKAAQTELDQLETLVRDERMNLESKKIQLNVASAKSQKRIEPAGVDALGNEYWIFNDLLDHLTHAKDYRNSEPCWAYGVVIIGPGFKHPEEDKVQWWSITGIKDLTHLLKWITQQAGDNDSSNLAKKIQQRIDHLSALECVVYGEGFFT